MEQSVAGPPAAPPPPNFDKYMYFKKSSELAKIYQKNIWGKPPKPRALPFLPGSATDSEPILF